MTATNLQDNQWYR